MSGIMNTNSIFYTDDTLDNIANMAVGIGVGGFLGGIQGGWALRKAANSKAMEAERVGAYDPKGFERVRRGSGPLDDFLGKTWLGYEHELETSLITNQMIHDKALDRKSTRRNPVTHAQLVCRLLLENNKKLIRPNRRHEHTAK